MSNNYNQLNIPQAREAGDLGGQMVRRCVPYELRDMTGRVHSDNHYIAVPKA